MQRLTAIEREGGGSRVAARLRKTGRTPAILFSLPQNESRLISVDSKEATSLVRHPYVEEALSLFREEEIQCLLMVMDVQVRIHGRKGLLSRIFQLDLAVPDKAVQSYPVLV